MKNINKTGDLENNSENSKLRIGSKNGTVKKELNITTVNFGNSSHKIDHTDVDKNSSSVPKKGVSNSEVSSSVPKKSAEVIPSVKGRKGVGVFTPNNSSSVALNTKSNTTTTTSDIQTTISNATQVYSVTKKTDLDASLKDILNSTIEETPQNKSTIAIHSKPQATVDGTAGSMINTSDNENNPIIIAVIVITIVSLLITTILGYKHLKDVWSKRHYSRMDFLVDGMYDM